MKRTAGVTAILLPILVGGCFARDPISLNSDNAAQAVPAIKLAADQNNRAALPRLVADLDDNDSAIRFAAINALRRMVGQDFGYRYYEDEYDRRDSLILWRRWLAQQSPSTRRAAAPAQR